MSEVHNITDLRIIQVHQNEHNQIRDLLKTFPTYYDPTESLVDIIKTVLEDARIIAAGAESRRTLENQLRREVSYLKSEIQALTLEKNNAKMAADPCYLDGPVLFGRLKGKTPLR